jgi:plasmid stabilization system protein ParE
VKVRFTDTANMDLEAIGDWIAQEDPQRAVTFVRELRKAAGALARYPRRYPALAGSRFQVRKKVHREYLIFYRVDEAEVRILRVVHGSRDWAAILS